MPAPPTELLDDELLVELDELLDDTLDEDELAELIDDELLDDTLEVEELVELTELLETLDEVELFEGPSLPDEPPQAATKEAAAHIDTHRAA